MNSVSDALFVIAAGIFPVSMPLLAYLALRLHRVARLGSAFLLLCGLIALAVGEISAFVGALTLPPSALGEETSAALFVSFRFLSTVGLIVVLVGLAVFPRQYAEALRSRFFADLPARDRNRLRTTKSQLWAPRVGCGD